MRKIREVKHFMPQIGYRKRVAAYARVSMATEHLLNSFSQQVSYYHTLIQNNPAWIYVEVYADKAVSGTRMVHREAFNRMIADCDEGKIDLILVKSVSRFARNTVDLLNIVRRLRALGVEIWFEEQQISSMSEGGELMLTLMASFAQAEVESLSENSKWAVQKGFEQGRPANRNRTLGYCWCRDELTIVQEEAVIIRQIYADFLAGISRRESARRLTAQGVVTVQGMAVTVSSLSYILTNPSYTGDMLLQKTYVVDPITHKKRYNRGELPQYYVTDSHGAIVSREDFARVQHKMADNRQKKKFPYNRTGARYPFTHKIICGRCGRGYSRQLWKNGHKERPTWVCTRKIGGGTIDGEGCSNQNLIEHKLMALTAEVLGQTCFNEAQFYDEIEKIIVTEEKQLVFYFHDGRAERRMYHARK